jgi:predicted MFS family arabinose efflux permease
MRGGQRCRAWALLAGSKSRGQGSARREQEFGEERMTRRSSYLTVLICGAAILTFSTGLRQGFGLFLKPMTIDLGIGREVFALGIAINNLLWGAAGPFAGAIADKYGPGRVAALGGLSYAFGLVVLGLAGDGTFVILGNILIGLALSGTGFSVILAAVTRATPPEKRSLALGIVTAGGSFGQFSLVPYGYSLLDTFGWSLALMMMGATVLLIIPLASGVAGWQADARAQGAQSLSQALAEASRHSGFWLLTAGFFVCGFQLVFVGTHLPAFLADQAMPAWVASWALALIGLFNIVGSYTAGVLGIKLRKKYVLACIYLARSAAFLLFMILPLSPSSVLILASLLGLLWLSTVPLTSGLVAQIFGPTYMSTLYAIVFFSHQVGSFLGAWLGGKAFDMLGSYDVMWWLCIGAGVFAAAMHWPIPDKPMPRLAAAGATA